MVLRKSFVLTGLFAIGFSCWVSALGLGELTLHSTLDEPFDAEIELVNIGDADENQILVGLASKKDFERAGVSWEFHLLNLKFKTDLSDAEHPVVKVSSDESIKEPYLDFVAQLQWPAGRLLREYTLFLDLPVFDTQKAIPSTEATVSTPPAKNTEPQANAPTTQAPVARRKTTGSARSTSAAAASPGIEYRVKGGDTLWGIASKAELGATTVQQRMVAIHAANPRAFVNGDANLLKKGAVLRLPDLANVESINRGEANQRVADQSRAWNEQHKQKAVRELIGDVPASTQSKVVDTKDGLLRLSTPTETITSNAQQLGRTVGGVGSSASTDVLQNELGIAQEELDRSKRENLELKSKLAALEAQVSTQAKLLELESDELKAVQLGVSADKEVLDDATGADSVSSEVAAVDTPAVGDMGDTGSGAETQSTVKGPLSGLLTFLQSNWIPLAGLLAVLLGVLFLVAKSKKEDQPELIEPFLSPDIDVASAGQVDASETGPSIEEEPPVEAEPSPPEPDSQEIAQAEVVEEVDPVGEADIYQSLGNFSEAESVIEKAIDASPNDSRLHLKRLDLFAAQQDIEGFDAYYPTLLALDDSAATATADRLRANIPEVVPEGMTHELTLEEQVAEELGIDGLELDLSDAAESASEADDELVVSDEVSSGAGLDAELASSFVDSSEGELDLSEIELDLQPVKSPASTDEGSDEDLDVSLFDDISLPDELDELSTDISTKEMTEVVEIDLQDAELESEKEEGLELSLDSFDFDNDDELDLEIVEDESNTQLELAQAYIEMGDESGAKDILADVVKLGSDEQKQQANDLLAKLS